MRQSAFFSGIPIAEGLFEKRCRAVCFVNIETGQLVSFVNFEDGRAIKQGATHLEVVSHPQKCPGPWIAPAVPELNSLVQTADCLLELAELIQSRAQVSLDHPRRCLQMLGEVIDP